MRLYLSSYRIGNRPETLVELSRGGPIAIIENALDYKPHEDRLRYAAEVYDSRTEFSAFGLETWDLDLRKYFGDSLSLKSVLKECGLVWVVGGNAFLLMRALRQSGFPEVIRELLNADEIGYGGFSAGAVVATPTLRGIELMDDPTQIAHGYPDEIVWDGMGLVDFSIVPHYRSDHPEAPAAEKAVAYMEANQFPYKTLVDGDVYVSKK